MLSSYRSVVALTVVLAVVFAVSGWSVTGVDREGLALELALVLANTLPLLLVRRNPLVVVLVLAVTYPVWLITGHGAHLFQSLPTLAALFFLGAWDRPLWLRAFGPVSPVWMLGASVAGWWDADPLEIGYVAVVFVTVWMLGVLMATRRDHVVELEAKTAALEAAERQLAHRAVAEERSRIARELHDVVAHAMSVITVQAGVGAHLIDSRPEQAAEALSTIERTGREAMSEMRRMLAVLQGSATTSRSDPQPGLADLHRLAEQVRAAGVPVTLETEGSARPLSPGLDLAAYRVAQEALTNVVKHAPRSRAEVAVRYRPDRVVVEVRQHGPAVAGPVVAGQGLRGMAERVALYDGDLEFGPEPDGFRVAADFPIGESE